MIIPHLSIYQFRLLANELKPFFIIPKAVLFSASNLTRLTAEASVGTNQKSDSLLRHRSPPIFLFDKVLNALEQRRTQDL